MGSWINIFYTLRAILKLGLTKNVFIALCCTFLVIFLPALFTFAGAYALSQKLYMGEIIVAIQVGGGLKWVQIINDTVWKFLESQQIADRKQHNLQGLIRGTVFTVSFSFEILGYVFFFLFIQN